MNIYKELEEDIDGFKRPDHGYLMSWAQQGQQQQQQLAGATVLVCFLLFGIHGPFCLVVAGVLLLNAVLTVRRSNAASHAKQVGRQKKQAEEWSGEREAHTHTHTHTHSLSLSLSFL